MGVVLDKVVMTKEKRELYASLLILDKMINNHSYLEIGKYDSCIDDILIDLNAKGYINLEGTTYVPTSKGRDILSNFLKRYEEFRKAFEVYSRVDVQTGEFAYEKFFDIEDDGEWEEYKDNDRFEDLRLAIASFKGMDPLECAVLIFMTEGEFDTQKKGWEFDLTSTLIWDDVENLVRGSKNIQDLSYEDEGDVISGESVMEDVIRQGAEFLVDIKKREAENDAQDEEEECEEEYEEEVVTYVEVIEDDYYDPYYYEEYYDPWYVAPVFVGALILL